MVIDFFLIARTMLLNGSLDFMCIGVHHFNCRLVCGPITIIPAKLRSQDILREHRMLSRQLSEGEMIFSTFKGAQTRMHRGSSIKSLLCWRSLIALSALKSSPMTIILAELRSQDTLRERRMFSRH